MIKVEKAGRDIKKVIKGMDEDKKRPQIEKAIYKAMWPNQPIDVCEKHAQALTKVGEVIGLQVPLVILSIRDSTLPDCTNCVNESKEDQWR